MSDRQSPIRSTLSLCRWPKQIQGRFEMPSCGTDRDAIIGSNLMDIDHPRILLEIIDGQVVDYTRNKSFDSKLPSLETPIPIRRRWSRNSCRNNLKFTFEIENRILFTNRRSLNWNNLPFAVATESRANSPALLTERVGQTSQIEARQEVWVS